MTIRERRRSLPAVGSFELLLLLLLLLVFRGTWRGSSGSLLQQFRALIIQRRPDPHIHRQTLSGVALINAPHRRHIAIIASARDHDMPLFHELARGRIEPDPARVRNIGLHPRMGSLPPITFSMAERASCACRGTR